VPKLDGDISKGFGRKSGKDERPARRCGLRIISLTEIIRHPKMVPELERVLIFVLITDTMVSRIKSEISIENVIPHVMDTDLERLS